MYKLDATKKIFTTWASINRGHLVPDFYFPCVALGIPSYKTENDIMAEQIEAYMKFRQKLTRHPRNVVLPSICLAGDWKEIWVKEITMAVLFSQYRFVFPGEEKFRHQINWRDLHALAYIHRPEFGYVFTYVEPSRNKLRTITKDRYAKLKRKKKSRTNTLLIVGGPFYADVFCDLPLIVPEYFTVAYLRNLACEYWFELIRAVDGCKIFQLTKHNISQNSKIPRQMSEIL